MSNRTFTIERARDDEASFAEALGMAAALHRQGAMAPMNTDKVTVAIYEMMASGLAIFARAPSGRAIGMLLLTEEPMWYSDELCLHDMGLWIEPEWRKTGVLRGMLAEAKRLADERSTLLVITITSPDRRKKSAPEEAQIIGYVSVGYAMKLQGKRHVPSK